MRGHIITSFTTIRQNDGISTCNRTSTCSKSKCSIRRISL